MLGNKRTVLIVVVATILTSSWFEAWAASDFQWTFGDSGMVDYILTSVSSSAVFSGSLNASDPTLTLIVGKRYEVTVIDSSMHPIEILSKGASSGSDVVLLAQGGLGGSLESDAGINWVDSGGASNGKVEFTVTNGLVQAMMSGGKTPGYRCGVHTSVMRGNFVIDTGELTDPIPESIPLGNVVVELETVVDGLAAPLGAAFPDDGTGRMFVYDQAGTVTVIENGVPLGTPFLNVTSRLVSLGVAGPGSYDERGLLGFALHPSFGSVSKVYTYTSEPVAGSADFNLSISSTFDHQSVIAEWTVDNGNPNIIDVSTRRELLRIDEPQFNHNGGALRFGADGYLYISLGDGGEADDEGDGHGTDGNGQNIDTVHGSILRIDVDGGGILSANGSYGIPADNPFVGAPGVDEIYAYGFRNPYSFSFDSETGTMYVADVGQNDVEEVDIVTAGGNYGWRIKEGSFYFNPNGAGGGFVTDTPVVDPVPAGLIDPIAEYDHDDGISIIGGFVYHGSAPELQDRYVLGDFGRSFAEPSGRLFYLDAGNNFNELRIGLGGAPLGLWVKGFAQDLDGNVYVCGSERLGPSGSTGVVMKIVPVNQQLPGITTIGVIVLFLTLTACGFWGVARRVRWQNLGC